MTKTETKPFIPALKRLFRRPELLNIPLALGLGLIMEALCRHSPAKALAFLAHPFVFIFNCAIVYFYLTLPLYFRRRRALTLFASMVWLGLAISNCIVLFFRTTPFSAMDLLLIFSVWSIFENYLNLFQIVLIIAAFLAAVGLFVLAFIRLPKSLPDRRRALAATLASALLILGGYFAGLRSAALSDSFANLSDAYRDYGFAYCFTVSVFDRGISKPDDYSPDVMDDILEELENEPAKTSELPNIIMVQLESFFDPKYVRGLSFSSDPVPVFTALKDSCPHAFLTVPSIGAGTANTEFEILTGMSLDYFGAGEYPYQTILRSSTCETVNYNLSSLGYRCHAIHNNSGTFYDRHRVFPMLGFDTFTSVEYMPASEPNPLGWTGDRVLTSCVMDCLRQQQSRDFIYTISVQAHGKYPDELPDGYEPSVLVTGTLPADEDGEELLTEDAWNYYLSELHETDAFIGQLIAELSAFDEPVLLVLFGDHLPNLSLTAEILDNEDIFQTEYLLWNNYGLTAQACELSAYQLTAYVQELMGVCCGDLTALHQSCRRDEDYQEKLEMLEYDMLYGEQICFDGVNPYEPTELEMGVKSIELYNIRPEGELYCADGRNFTPFSVVMADDENCETIFVSSSKLLFHIREPEDNTVISVAQVGEDGTVLSRTNSVFFD